MLAAAPSLWDPHVGLGTVTHQNVGYLFPMGPFFWVLEELVRMPAWVAQRLWLGTLLFAAGMGMRYLLKTLGVLGPGLPVAMLAYAFTPYVLEYSDRLSVLLGPWAALPWLIAFSARALRTRGWRYPALIALTVQLVGGVNATALLYALIGPVVYLVFAVLTHETDGRRLRSALWRTALLTAVTSLWWLSGLFVESRYGLDVLRFTEKITDVSATAYPFEIVRGLGYWLFYGRTPVDWWDRALLDFTRDPVILLVSLLIPALAMFASSLLRWRYRLFCVVLVVVGVAIAVGAAPYGNPSIVGGVFKSFATSSTLGLALRSTSRATPLVALGFAGLLAAGINAFAARMQATSRPRLGMGAAFVIGALCLVNAVGLWKGTYYSSYYERGAVPAYWKSALAAANAGPHDTRLLSMPGSGEAAYTWGDTIDPIEPGLIDRPFDARELVPMGSAAGANLLQALDGRLQAGTLDPNAVAPIARLMAVGDVLLRNDLQSDAFNLVPADTAWRQFTDPRPTGLGSPTRYGTKPKGRKILQPLPDSAEVPPADATTPPVAIFPVEDAQPIVRVEGAAAPVVVAGDGEGLVDLASAGLVDAKRPILYAASYAKTPSALRALPQDAVLVLTDSNRRRAQRGGLSNIYGVTESAGEKPLVTDPSDQRIEVFPGETDASRTVDEMSGVRSIQATSYGSIFGFTPSVRPAAAFDGDSSTAWAPSNQSNQKLVLDLSQPITTDHLNIEQPAGADAPYVRLATLRFDGGHAVRVTLDRSSQLEAGETVHFPTRRFSKLEIDIDRVHKGKGLAAFNAYGFSEVRVADDAPGAQPVRAVESMRLPTDLLSAYGASSAQHPLVVAMSAESTMDQLAVRRTFSLPTARSFSVTGTAVLSDTATDRAIVALLGLPGVADGGAVATSDTELASPAGRAFNALDGDAATAWNTPVNHVRGSRIDVQLPATTTIDHLDLQLRADGRHSVPTQLRITGDDGSRLVTLPKAPLVAPGGVDAVSVSFAPLHTRTLGVTITKDDAFVSRTSSDFVELPAGVAELGIPGVHVARTPAQLPGTCTSGLFTIDGNPVSVRFTGSTADALAGRPVTISACDAGAAVALGTGSHQLVGLRNQRGVSSSTPFDLQRLVLASAAGGSAAPASASAIMTSPDPSVTAAVTVQHQTRTSMKVRVPASSSPRWLVFGESLNSGWHATIAGHDLGAPQLIDGYANGWLLPANAVGHAVTVSLVWTPQKYVWIALWLSLAGGIVCLAILLWSFVLARRRQDALVMTAPYEDSTIALRPPRLEPALARQTAPTVAAVVALAVLSGAVVRPWVGVLIGGLTYLSIRDRRARFVVRYAPAAIAVAIALYMAAAQAITSYASGTHWPSIFSWARVPTWIALFLLLVDATVDWLWRRNAPP